MKIVITGISGTVGIAFTELLKSGNYIQGIDRNESSVASFKQEHDILVRVGDFVDGFDMIDFKSYDLLIHLAAMKHIDICEAQPNSCVLNNVVKTYELFRKAHSLGIDILFMSTDKAVEPASVYGYSKALAEAMVLEVGGSFARSGNIVESSGSIMKIWDEAISKGKPLRITDPTMQRFFITPENLVKRIWQQYQKGVKIIIPKMDREVTLLDLAKEKLEQHGLGEDYPIEYIGLRPGEKLKEKLQ